MAKKAVSCRDDSIKYDVMDKLAKILTVHECEAPIVITTLRTL